MLTKAQQTGGPLIVVMHGQLEAEGQSENFGISTGEGPLQAEERFLALVESRGRLVVVLCFFGLIALVDHGGSGKECERSVRRNENQVTG